VAEPIPSSMNTRPAPPCLASGTFCHGLKVPRGNLSCTGRKFYILGFGVPL
ncbi:hypothetical protein CCACVL1_01032, partial [Corchorus capsularis]